MTVPQFTSTPESLQDVTPDGPLAYLVPKLFANRAIDPVTGCWLWTGAMMKEGYGCLSVAGKSALTHRLAAAIWLDLDLSDRKLVACHNCPGGDNPRCFNPAHLFVGTRHDNMIDRMAKGSSAPGARVYGSPLSASDVAEIRRLRAEGVSGVVIGRQFGIGQPAVSRIFRGVRWPKR